MDMTHTPFWEDTNIHPRIKFEGCSANDDVGRPKDDRGIFQCCEANLNFSTATCSEDDSEYGPYKKNKVTRQDPMSHRIIEKRRRDRMNNCLADLSRLIPTEYLKKGRGRIEKTEIIEMAIKHMKYLQQEHGNPSDHYRMGYQECMSETMRFMVEVEGHFPREGICVRILNHLQKHCDNLSRMNRQSASTPLVVPSSIDRRLTPHIIDQSVQQHQQQQQQQQQQQNSNLSDHQQQQQQHRLQQHQQQQQLQQVQMSDYQTPKDEPNNNNGSFTAGLSDGGGSEIYDKHLECNGNGLSYKYKTNIKLRFNQDLNEGAKRQKLETNGRRASVTSVENHSSSRSSPPSSDLCARISEQDHPTVSPAGSTSSLNHMKTEVNNRETSPYSHHQLPRLVPTSNGEDKNFNVPIFVLHAKGSYYLPLTIDYKTLLPYLRNYDILELGPGGMHNIVLHPVTINVNFQPNTINGKYKSEYNNNWN